MKNDWGTAGVSPVELQLRQMKVAQAWLCPRLKKISNHLIAHLIRVFARKRVMTLYNSHCWYLYRRSGDFSQSFLKNFESLSSLYPRFSIIRFNIYYFLTNQELDLFSYFPQSLVGDVNWPIFKKFIVVAFPLPTPKEIADAMRLGEGRGMHRGGIKISFSDNEFIIEKWT